MTALSVKARIEAKRGSIAATRAKGLRTYKFKAGKTTFRILPSADGGEWDRRFGVTYLKPFDEKNFFAIGDREITYGTADPIREMLFDAMREATDKDMKDHYYKMVAKPRILFNALILDDKDQDAKKPVLIDMSETQFDNILAQFEAWTEVDPDYDLASLDTGHNFTCEKTGEKLDTKYVFLAAVTKNPLVAADLEGLVDMDAWIQSQFEMKETKAIEFLAKLNASAGLTTTVSAGSLTGPAAITSPALSAAAVTTLVEDEPDAVTTAEAAIVDAEVTEVLTDEQLAQIAEDEEEAEVAAAIAKVKADRAAAKLAAAPAAAEVVAEPAAAAAVATTDASDIDDILKGLE